MKNTILIAATTMLAATLARAQIAPPIRYDIESDMQQTQTLDDQNLQQGSDAELHVRIRSGGRQINLTGLTAEWRAQETATSTQWLGQVSSTTVTNTTPHYFKIMIDSTATGSAVTNWLYTIRVSDGNRVFVLGEGRLDIKASSWTGPGAQLISKIDVDFSDVDSYTNTTTHGPVRADGVTITSTNNADGSITLTSIGSAASWVTVSGKPFETLDQLTTNNLTGVEWGDFVQTNHTGNIAITGTVTATSFVGDGSQLTGVDGLPDGTGTNQFVMYDSTDWIIIESATLAQGASPQQLRDPFTVAVEIPVVDGTATVTRALGNELYLELTGNTTLAYSTADFPATGAMTWSLAVNRGTHVLSLDTNLFDTTTFDALTIEPETWYRVIGSKGYGQTKAEVY